MKSFDAKSIIEQEVATLLGGRVGSLVDGVQNMASAATGDTSLDAWWGKAAERAAAAEKDAASTLEAMAKPAAR